MHSPLTRLLIPLVVLLATLSARTADADKKTKNRISAVSFDDAGQQTTIEIRGSSTPTFTVYKLDRPTRVVVDIAGATLNDKVKDAQENGATMAVGTWAVNQLAAYELDDGGKLVRVVVTLARPGRYDVKSDGNDVVVTVVARDDAPEAPDAEAIEAAQAAAEKAKQDSEEAKTARAKAEKDAAKAKGQADTSKQEADAAKQALAEAKVAAAKAEKKSKAERDRADRALAEAKAAADRTKQAAAEAKAEAERTKKAVADANARAEKTMKVAERAKAELETMKEELAAAKADAQRMKEQAAAAKADADAAKADASAQRKKAGDAEKAAADAEKAAAAARREKADSEKAAASAAKASADDKKAAAAAKQAAAKAKQAAERLEAEAADARAEAKRARAEAEAAQQAAVEAKAQAAAAKKEAAAQKRDAEAAKAEAASQKKDAAAMRAEAERMLGEAKARLEDASAEAKAAKKSQEAAVAAQTKAEKKEKAARAAEAKAAGERKAAEKALADAEKARAAGDDDAEKRIADAEARLKKAEKARTTAEEQRRAAETTAEEARALAERRKGETDDAVAARAAAEKEKKAAAKAATEADQRAARAEALRKEEDTAAAAAAEAKAAGNRAEAKRLEKEAAQAKKAREQEETQLAAIVAERRAVEADLADAKQAADAARKDAAAAEKRAAAARKEADDAEARAAAAKVELARAEKAQKEIKAKKVEPPPARKAEPAKARPKAIAIEDVTFVQKGDDAKVIVAMSGEVEPVVKASGKRIEMTLTGVDLPKKLERTLDVTKFDGAVRSVSSYRDGGKVRVVVDLSSEITPKVERSGTTVRMSFAGAGAVAKKPKKAKSKVKTESIPAPVVGGYGASSAPVTSKSVAQAGGSRRKVYRGPTIDLDFKDADIHNLLRFLANIGRVSIVVPDDIKATVTVRLKRVPWDQALEVILASKGLWYRKEGNLYRVAPRKVLDAEDQAEAERIRAAVQSEVPEAEVFTLNYASADETSEKLAPLLSPKGKIEVDSRTNSLIINDIRSHRRRVIDLATRLDIQTPQIMIEARIVEARSTYARDIGIQWGGSANASQAGGNATGLIFPNSIAVAGGNEDRQTPVGGVATPSDFAINLPAVTGTRAGAAFGISLGSVGGNFNLNLRLSAAEDTGTVRIVSSPKIMVLNNVEAEISQGQSIPISVVSAQGTQTQFVPAELSLKVTPFVSGRDCAIAMNVEVTKNEPDFVNTGARGDPTILTKEAKTRLLVADGETTVLGGITTRNSGVAYNKVPFFGDLPVVGWFFKRRVENDDRTELLIFITPRITNKAFLRCE